MYPLFNLRILSETFHPLKESQINVCNFCETTSVGEKNKRRKRLAKKKEAQFFLLACCLGLPLHIRVLEVERN